MATIVVKDLPESIDLDREAMTSITGGARMRAPKTIFTRTMSQGARIVNYPPGFPHSPLADVKGLYKK